MPHHFDFRDDANRAWLGPFLQPKTRLLSQGRRGHHGAGNSDQTLQSELSHDYLRRLWSVGLGTSEPVTGSMVAPMPAP